MFDLDLDLDLDLHPEFWLKGKHSTSWDMLDPAINKDALSKEALELRLRDRRIKEHRETKP